MTDPLLPRVAPTSAGSIPWRRIWLRALTEPRVDTYTEISEDPAAGLGKACLWVFLASAVGSAILMAAVLALAGLGTFDMGAETGVSRSQIVTGLVVLMTCVTPFSGLFAVVGLLFSSGISHALARALGGSGEYHRLAYTIAAYLAPGSLVGSITALIPFLNWLGLFLSAYMLFLNVLAIRSVHRLTWGRALLSSSLFVGVAVVTVACGAIVVLALLGPAIGNVFSNIVSDI